MSSIEQVSQGNYANEYNYTDPFDAASPWSVILVFMPETVSPKEYVRALDNAPEVSIGKQDLDKEVKQYISSTLKALGWTSPSGSTSVAETAQRFMQLRLRQIDAASGSIKWDSSAKYVDSEWYRGIIRPLTLLREKYTINIPLAEFETMDAKQVLDTVCTILTAENASHIVNYIVEPYTLYAKRPELLSAFVQSIPLSAALKLSSNASLKKALLENSYSAPLDLRLLNEISARIDNPQLKSDICVASILHPAKLQDVADIRSRDEEYQLKTISQFVLHYSKPFGGIWHDIDTLISACPSVDKSKVQDLVLNEAMRRNEFNFILQQNARWPSDLVKSRAQEYLNRARAQLLAGEKDITIIPSILSACKLIDSNAASAQYEAIQILHNRYRVLPSMALSSTSISLLEKVLELHPRAYQNHDSLVKYISDATQSPLDVYYARGQFVEFALVDNNFNAAVQLCESMDVNHSATWIAYLQTTRFISSLWNHTPPKILAKKKELITTCIRICPPGDISTVLKVQESIFDDDQVSGTAASDVSQPVSSAPNSRSFSNSASQGSKRKGVQNLLVSGIGWAIGAPVDDN